MGNHLKMSANFLNVDPFLKEKYDIADTWHSCTQALGSVLRAFFQCPNFPWFLPLFWALKKSYMKKPLRYSCQISDGLNIWPSSTFKGIYVHIYDIGKKLVGPYKC